MDTINPFAFFDSIFIANKLNTYMGDFNFSEIQLFCYFSCLLSLYEGHPVASWGYKFIKNDLGVPLSIDIQNSLANLLSKNEIEEINNYYKITQRGQDKSTMLSNLQRFNERIKYLENACDSLLVLPVGNIRSSIANEPVIKSVTEASVRALMWEDDGAIELLYDQFEMLKTALNIENADLFVPAVTWLKYLQTYKGTN